MRIVAQYIGQVQQAGDLLRYARDVLRDAERQLSIESQLLRERAAELLWQRRKKAYLTGYKNGLREAKKEQVKALLRMEQERQEILSKAHADCLSLCLSVAKSFIGENIAGDTKTLSKRISSGIMELAESGPLSVTVHPESLEGVREELSSHHFDIKVRGDTEVSPGNAVIESSVGVVELDWEEHLREISSVLSEELEKATGKSS